jgi:seryl-tRNA synthetase
MSEDIKKITPEELENVQKVRSKYQEITVKLGQIQVQRMQITNQIEMLNKAEEDLRKEWGDTQAEEQTAISDLQEKYGKVNINLDSGEINES